MNRRNTLGIILVVVGVAFATLALAATMSVDKSSHLALGLVTALVALAALAGGWLQLRDAGTPQEIFDRAPPASSKGASVPTPEAAVHAQATP
jgi:drug/metabolite transporter (DMT)-like permease